MEHDDLIHLAERVEAELERRRRWDDRHELIQRTLARLRLEALSAAAEAPDADEAEPDEPEGAPAVAPRRRPLDVGAVRRDRRRSTSGPPERPPGAILAGPADGRFVYVDPSVPEALRFVTFLRDLLSEAPHLHSIVVTRAALPAGQLGNTGVDSDGTLTWVTIEIADDLSRYDPEAERVLRHELGHLVHIVSAGERWRDLVAGDEAEDFAAAAEVGLSAGASAAAYLSATHPPDEPEFSYGRAPRWCSGGDGAA